MSTQEAEDLDAKINELTQKENSILENHKALWEKVFNSIDKSTVKDATATNYLSLIHISEPTRPY